MSMLALDKVALFLKTVRANGGIIGLLNKLWRMDTVKEGTLVGCDENGNKYFENDRYMIPRNRWVEYNPKFKFEYDASQITPEWYGWIHHKTDRLPCQDCAKLQLSCNCCVRCWLMPPEENRSATIEAYYPYTTVNNHIKVWDDACRLPYDVLIHREFRTRELFAPDFKDFLCKRRQLERS